MIKKIELNDVNLNRLFNAEIDDFIKGKINEIESYLKNEDLFNRCDFERLLQRKIDNVTSRDIESSKNIGILLNEKANHPKFRTAAVDIEKTFIDKLLLRPDDEVMSDVNITLKNLEEKKLYGVSCSFMSYGSGIPVWLNFLSKNDDLKSKADIIFNEVLKEREGDLLGVNDSIKNINNFVKERIKNDFFESSTLERSPYLSKAQRSLLEDSTEQNQPLRPLRNIRI